VFHSTLTICVGHKIVESIVYATMGPLEFLMMSPSFQDDGDNYNVICLLFIMIIHNFFWNFDSQVCDTLWIQEYRMTYTSFLNLKKF
jgi:hypothetical protein